ncbi:MAG: hypothetical protein D6718_09405 [Acidobacteria bacterium]|nr:MAG: hypothetical protein D6718_09405 [Acidobacteriota bacterium]
MRGADLRRAIMAVGAVLFVVGTAAAEVPVVELPAPDVAAAMEEDARTPRGVRPFRVGLPRKTDISPDRAAAWRDLQGGGKLWTVSVRSPGALWLVLGFGTFRPLPGAELRVMDPSRTHVLGPYTHRDIRPHGQLWLPPLPGDTAVIELLWPAELAGKRANLHLGTVSHGYRPWGGIGGPGPGDTEPEAGSCNIDINCPLGADWQDDKRGVVNLLSGGSGYCSGSLIATTAADCRNLVLTAHHCLSTAGEAASTTFQFNFERPQCGSGSGRTDQTVTGSTLVATYAPSDFTLLELDVDPPESYNVYYNGWSRSSTPASASWCIHHPNNDEKSISRNLDPLVDGRAWGPDHWRVTEWEDGTTEPGSSGSPLFDPDHRIVGQLHGGTASCTSHTYDEFGKLSVSWTGGGTPSTRLSDWLDPAGTGAVTQDGIDASFCRVPRPRLVYDGHVVDDSAGNGNGVADPGETFVLEVDSRNTGTLGATHVQGTLSTSTPDATVTDPAADWPDIPEGTVRRSLPPHFTVELAPTHPCGDPIAFTLDMTALEDPGSWTSDFEVPVGTASTNEEFRDDMEQGPNGWTTQSLTGSNDWVQTTADSSSPSHSWFVSDIGSVSDSVLVMPLLTSLPERSVLRFQHRMNSESGYDGGVLEYSADGGPWQDAGPLIVSGGYTATISTSYGSPLAGREAWSGDYGGWTEVEVDLATLAGSDVRFRWRFATDESVSDEGWYIDDVVVESTSYTCNTPPALPGEASDPAGPGRPFTVTPDPGGYRLEWSEPPGGGPVVDYVLYRTDLRGFYDPACEANLGAGTSAVLPDLPADHGLLVVARNGAGEGPYGRGSDGTPRGASSAPCP